MTGNIPFGRNSAFTLSELIVVITMLAVLATVGLLALSGYSQDARDTANKSNVRSVSTAIASESASSGNSPRYYVIYDTGAALSGAVASLDNGSSLILAWGDWNQAWTNYSAGNPDYAKLKLNPEKFKVAALEYAPYSEAIAAYDPKYLTVGAIDGSIPSPNGRRRTVSYFQAAGISPASGIATVAGTYQGVKGASAGLIRDPLAPTSNTSLSDGVKPGTVSNISGDDVSWRKWSDGTVAASCLGYFSPPVGKSYDGSTGSGNYWIDPDGSWPTVPFKAYCDMGTNDGGWLKVTATMIAEFNSSLTAVKASDSVGGLVYQVSNMLNGCWSGPDSRQEMSLPNSFAWKEIRYTQAFTGGVSCWEIFGTKKTIYTYATNIAPFSLGTDKITGQIGMGGSTWGNSFDGNTARCDNTTLNFWHGNNGPGLRSATVTLRRSDPSQPSYLSTGMSCVSADASFSYSDIFVR